MVCDQQQRKIEELEIALQKYQDMLAQHQTQELKNQMNQLQAVQQKVVADQAQLRCTINTMQHVENKPDVPGSIPEPGGLIISPSSVHHQPSGSSSVGNNGLIPPSFCQKNQQFLSSNSPVITQIGNNLTSEAPPLNSTSNHHSIITTNNQTSTNIDDIFDMIQQSNGNYLFDF